MNIIVATIKSWNIENANKLFKSLSPSINWMIISNKEQLTLSNIRDFKPDYIFFPHWSWKIPKEIYHQYECVVFHMSDVPYGRGGSPLQNLIINENSSTKISALAVEEELDSGGVYLKEDLSLYGTADEILMRASDIIFFKMLPAIINKKLKPADQIGEAVYFVRRRPEQSEIKNTERNLEQLYNHIRMLDGEGYPPAFIENSGFRFEFSRASFKNGRIIADVIIKEVERE